MFKINTDLRLTAILPDLWSQIAFSSPNVRVNFRSQVIETEEVCLLFSLNTAMIGAALSAASSALSSY